MAQADSAPPIETVVVPPRKPAPRGLVIAALGFLLVFVIGQGASLWQEWRSLQHEMATVRKTVVVGYPNIHPRPSYATKPENWFHDEGEFTLIWSGWEAGEGHRWFRVRRGEVDRELLYGPMGKDAIQAIDYPLVEVGGGSIWKKIPSEAFVAGLEMSGVVTAYPLQVLSKVCVINDQVAERPILVTFNPLVPEGRAVHVYEPLVEGRRVTMGLSGYFQGNKPILYDRATESLWLEVEAEEVTLEAIAGPRRGTRLRQLRTPTVVAWRDWSWQNPKGRLLIGADRSKLAPTF